MPEPFVQTKHPFQLVHHESLEKDFTPRVTSADREVVSGPKASAPVVADLLELESQLADSDLAASDAGAPLVKSPTLSGQMV